MRRVTIWLLSTVAALVLLFSYRTSTMGSGFADSSTVAAGTPGAGPTTVPGDRTPSASPSAASPSAAGPSTASPSAASSSAAGQDGGSGDGAAQTGGGTRTVDGSVAQTRFGPVQVRIVVSGGKITDVQAVQVPNGNHHDAAINSHAVPILREEALAAQSADIDTVSGATITSDAYRQSLQAAIDAAHL